MPSIWTRSPVRSSPLWKRPTPTKRRRGARGARPSFKDAVARLDDALAATLKAQGKLAQATNRLEAAVRRTVRRRWVVAGPERHITSTEMGGHAPKAVLVHLPNVQRLPLLSPLPHGKERGQRDAPG